VASHASVLSGIRIPATTVLTTLMQFSFRLQSAAGDSGPLPGRDRIPIASAASDLHRQYVILDLDLRMSA
jgi:hypothetical protein